MPDILKHCVGSVAKKHGGDVGKAFAICISSLQKRGILKKGTKELTAAGKKAERKHRSEPDASGKLAAYEKVIKRKGEDMGDTLERLRSLVEDIKTKEPYDWSDLEIEVRDLLAVLRRRDVKKMAQALDVVNEIAMDLVEKEMTKEEALEHFGRWFHEEKKS